MIDAFIDALQSFPRGLVFVAEGLIILALAKFARDLVTRNYKVDEEITTKANLAVALRLSGYLIAVILILAGVLYQPLSGGGWVGSADLEAAGFGFNGRWARSPACIPVLSRRDRCAQPGKGAVRPADPLQVPAGKRGGGGPQRRGGRCRVRHVRRHRPAHRRAVAGDTLGGGEGKAALVALAFFGMGLVLLVAFALFYELTTSFNIHDEIERDNVAVGVALGGNLVGIGLVTLKAVFGDFVGWGESIAAFLVFGVLGFVLLYVVRLLIDLILLPTVKISQALAEGRNTGVAMVESAAVISSALILFLAI